MSLIDEVDPCEWASSYCDLRHQVEVYLYGPRGRQEPIEVLLCRFHGQAWPKKNESEEEAHKRTRQAAATKMTPKSEQRSWARPPRNRRPTKEVPLPDQPEG